MESRKISNPRWCQRLCLLAFVFIEGAMLWQSYAPWLLRQVGHGE